MKRRQFLFGSVSAILASNMALLGSAKNASALVITLASVSKVASIAASALSMFGGKSNATPQLILQNYKLLVEVHKKLNELETLIIEVLKNVNALPEILRQEIENGDERKLNKEILAIVKAHQENVEIFSAASGTDNEDIAFEKLRANTTINLASIQTLRNELSFYSNFSLMALAGSAVSEVSMHVLLGSKTTELAVLRIFFKEQERKHADPTIAGSLASEVTVLKSRYVQGIRTLENMLASFPRADGKTIALKDNANYLTRCTVHGYSAIPHNGITPPMRPADGNKISSDYRGSMKLNEFYDRHENRRGKNRIRKADLESFTPLYTFNSRVQIQVHTFEAGGVGVAQVFTPDRPNSIATAGEKNAFNRTCPTRVLGRLNVVDKGFNAYVVEINNEAKIHNSVAEAFGVILEYEKGVNDAFSKLFAYFDEIGIPS